MKNEAFEKAISLNDHFVPAFVNLAKMSLREHEPPGQTLLENALRATGRRGDYDTLAAQLLNRHYDAAIATAHDVHAMPHQNLLWSTTLRRARRNARIINRSARRACQNFQRKSPRASPIMCARKSPRSRMACHRFSGLISIPALPKVCSGESAGLLWLKLPGAKKKRRSREETAFNCCSGEA